MTRIVPILALTALLLAVPVTAQDQETDAETAKPKNPKVKISTSLGDIVVELYADEAPITVHNFLRYAQEGYYKGTIFHRVMSSFMIQGGGFTANMEKKTEGLHEGIANEWRDGVKNERGTISMARLGGQPDSATSQFFINVVDNAALDRPQPDGAAYTAFGRVVEGMDVVDKIKDTEVERHPKYPSPQPVVPKTPVVIKSVEILGDYNVEEVAQKAEQKSAAIRKQKEAAQAEVKEQMNKAVAKIEAEQEKKFTTTDSGLMTLDINEGDGPSPDPTDMVSVHYRGKLVDGTEFDSSYKRDAPATFPLNRVIKGWTEGVSSMKVGGKRILVIPPELGYGKRGAPPRIPPNSPLIFEVELLEIQQPSQMRHPSGQQSKDDAPPE